MPAVQLSLLTEKPHGKMCEPGETPTLLVASSTSTAVLIQMSDEPEYLPDAEREIKVTQEIDAQRDAFVSGRDQVVIVESSRSLRPTVPAMLPRDVPAFTGRIAELARIDAIVLGGAAVISAIDGMPGVGKSALATHAAYSLAGRFPDGALYADLHGFSVSAEPADPLTILTMFLRHLGIRNEDMQDDIDQQSALFRQVASARRLLIVLDNVRTELQVRPLLPGAGTSLVLITSRSSLAGLEVDERISLDTLPPAEAANLLATVVGTERAANERSAVAQVAELCGRLPLALRIAAQVLATRPTRTMQWLAQTLADEQERLSALVAGDRQIRSAFYVSYNLLREADARFFRLLGLYPVAEFSTSASQAIASLTLTATGQALSRLSDAHLVIGDADDRFQLHDLLHLYARELCFAQDSETYRHRAMIRLVDHFVNFAETMNFTLDPLTEGAVGTNGILPAPSPIPVPEALQAFEADAPAMKAVLVIASDLGRHDAVARIAANMRIPLMLLGRSRESLTVCEAELRAARAAASRINEARALRNVGNAHSALYHYQDALNIFKEALVICQEIGDRATEAQVLSHIANITALKGDRSTAIPLFQYAIHLLRQVGDRQTESQAMNNLAGSYIVLGKHKEAADSCELALSISRETGNFDIQYHALNCLASAQHNMGLSDQAMESLRQALAICRENGDRDGEPMILMNIGRQQMYMNHVPESIAWLRQAIAACQRTDNRRVEANIAASLAEAYERIRDFEKAASALSDAALAFQRCGAKDKAELAEKAAAIYLRRSHRWWRRRIRPRS